MGDDEKLMEDEEGKVGLTHYFRDRRH